MLQLALPLCRRYCGPRILITCLDANIASARIIEANGGVLEDIIPDPFGRGPKRRYWIDLA
jgi:predicted acetyltransferase